MEKTRIKESTPAGVDFSAMWDPKRGYNRALIMHYASCYAKGNRAERTAKAWAYAKLQQKTTKRGPRPVEEPPPRKTSDLSARLARIERDLDKCLSAMAGIDKVLSTTLTVDNEQ